MWQQRLSTSRGSNCGGKLCPPEGDNLMAVYVDKAQHKLGRMVMCHMLADSMDELLEMADRIGVKRKWFQPRSHPHFDICKSSRAKAIAALDVPCHARPLNRVLCGCKCG